MIQYKKSFKEVYNLKKYLLPKNGNFYKANLHSHSFLSDGKLTPEEMKNLYKSHGYSVLAYTDHDIFIPHHDLTDENFLALSGFEAEFNEHNLRKMGGTPCKTCHLCFIAKSPDIINQPCFNPNDAYISRSKENVSKVQYDKTKPFFQREHTPESINEMIKTAREEGFFVTYNHPVWSFETREDYINFDGMNAMEIYNTESFLLGYPEYNPYIYDEMLRSGKKIFAVAADDNHNKYPEGHPLFASCGGFVMIKADELKYEKITDALFNGDFYASNGPEIYDLYIEDEKIHIKCSDCTKITKNSALRNTKIVCAEAGESINEAVFDISLEDVYVRLSIFDKDGKFAHTNAYFLL